MLSRTPIPASGAASPTSRTNGARAFDASPRPLSSLPEEVKIFIPLPELLEMQKKSFRDFLQADISPDKRKIQGLQATLLDVFPIANADDTMELQFLGYELGEPKYTIEEAISKDATYAAPVKAQI